MIHARSGRGAGSRDDVAFLVTCEHGGNRVPRRHAPVFRSVAAREALDSHQGWDPGALLLARSLASRLGAPLRFSRTTRLLVDLNREEESPGLFSRFSRRLDASSRAALIRDHHRRYRARVRRLAALGTPHRPVVHLSVHTFTPVLEGMRREVAIGVLFDPNRAKETRVAEAWIQGLRGLQDPAGRTAGGHQGSPDGIEANRPYLGVDDGLTTTLRTELPGDRYLGLELEVRQDVVASVLAPARGGVGEGGGWVDVEGLARTLEAASAGAA